MQPPEPIRVFAIILGCLLIPAVMWCLYGVFLLIDRYLFRL